MNAEQRRERVEYLFNKIDFIADLIPHKHTDEVAPHIKHLVPQLWEITQEQKRNHELDHKWVGRERPF